LIKPHSILFLPAILIYIGFLAFNKRCLFSRRPLLIILSFLIGAIATKFGISYILAGSTGLTIFGSAYGSHAATALNLTDKYAQLLLLSFKSLKGHSLILALIYGLPLTIAVTAILQMIISRKNQEEQQERFQEKYGKLSVFTLLIILNLILVAVFFTASVASSGPYETPYRLHLRYYNFALPLFYLIAFGALNNSKILIKPIRYIFGAAIAALGCYAILTNLVPYTPSYIDNPEFQGLYANNFYFKIIGSLLIFSLVLWLFLPRKGLQLYLYLVLPLFVLVSSYQVSVMQSTRLVKDVYDDAAIIAKHFLTAEDISKVIIVGSEPAGLFRALYYLDNTKASIDNIQRGLEYDLTKIPAGKDWVLLIGDHGIKGEAFYQIPMNGFTFIRVRGDNTLDFKKGAWPGTIKKVKGLSTPEIWGTWTQSDVVIFEFTSSLPNEFEIHLVAHAFGPNLEKEFEASIGNYHIKFSLSAIDEKRVIRLENPNGSNVLRFKIPNAASPKELGLSNDDRNLGIGFVEMKIVTIK
jgi:phosphoglycerol transferase